MPCTRTCLSSSSSPTTAVPRVERVALAAWFLVLVIGTLAPFDFSPSGAGLAERFGVALDFDLDALLVDLAAHFACFAGLGVLLVAAHPQLLHRPSLPLVLLAVAAFCFALDTLQLLLPERHGRLTDAIMNTVALGTAIVCCTRTSRGIRLAHAIATPPRFVVRRLAALVIAASAAGWTSVALQPTFGALRLDWDPSFPLLIGNEIYPPRPWLGEIQFVRIYDRALTAREASALAASPSGAHPATENPSDGLLLNYDFRADVGASLVQPGAMPGAALQLSVPRQIHRTADRGAIFERPATIRSRDAAVPLIESIEASGAFSVEVMFRPANLQQGGPARLVSLSDGWRKRNFMLGQEGRDLVFRVRNGVNGLSGSPHALKVPGAVDTHWQHVIAVYDHGVSLLYKNGRRFGAAMDLVEPSFYFPFGTSRIGWSVAAALLACLLALPLLVLLAFSGLRFRHTLAITSALVVGVSPYLVTCFLVGASPRAGFPAWFGAAVFLFYPLLAAYAGSPTRRLSIAERATVASPIAAPSVAT